MTPDEIATVIDRCIARLREHCDSVQIFCTRLDENGDTLNFNLGSGNWFARFGQVVEWTHRETERAKRDE